MKRLEKSIVSALSATVIMSGTSVGLPISKDFNKPAQIILVRSSSSTSQGLSDSDSDIYRINNRVLNKSCSKGIMESSQSLFGEMRNLTFEEEVAYMKGLDDISESTGVSLF